MFMSHSKSRGTSNIIIQSRVKGRVVLYVVVEEYKSSVCVKCVYQLQETLTIYNCNLVIDNVLLYLFIFVNCVYLLLLYSTFDVC